jgi:glucose/arabinose dehydrogenase
LAIAGIALLAGISSAAAATLPTGFEERTVASGLTAPTAVAWAPDGRMFVAEKGGTVRVVTATGALVSKPLIDISDHVNTNGDRGLLGLAVDSNFAANRFLYLVYGFDAHTSASDQPKSSRLTRFTVNADNTASAETILLGSHPTQPCPEPANNLDCMPSDSNSHSIGTVRSAPDGTLWVGNGDGSNYGGVDPKAVRTHNEQSLSGKILHIDRNGRGLAGHPFCPAVNDLSQVCTKVWAKGFRNPFRFTIRPNSLPSVGDVGWGSWEELNLTQPGRNYGWPCYEGKSKVGGYSSLTTCKDFYAQEGTPAGIAYPDHFYAHGAGSSIIGGPTYTGGPYPDEFDGDIVFGDYVQGFIKRLELDGAGKPTGTTDFVTGWFGVDIELWNGELYYVNFGDGSKGSGSVVRIAYSPNNATPIALATATPTFGATPLKVTFKGSGSSDPDGDTLKYEWDFGDGTAKSTAKDPVHTYNKGGNFDARLKVTDTRNASATAVVRISANNSPPVVTLAKPLDGANYQNGVPVQLSGSATDPDDGTLADARLSWNVVLVHGTHTHPFETLTGKSATFTPTSDHDADSYFRVTLTATDSDGVSTSKTVVIRPKTVNLSIASTPAGAPVSYAGYSLVAAPHQARAAIGFRTTVAAAQRFVAGGRAYEFTGWSDGGAITHDVTIPATDLSLVARYRDAGPVLQGVGGFGPGPDQAGPRIELRRASARRLAGKVSDPSGVKSLAVALRARKRRGGCRWWSAKRGKLARKGKDCAKPRWMKATLRPAAGGFAWKIALRGRLPKGRYTLAFRAVDGAGNLATSLAVGSRALRIGK